MSDSLTKIWLVYLLLLPFNLTFFMGAGQVMPADFILPVLLLLAVPGLFRRFGEIARGDYPVLLYLAAFLFVAAVAGIREGPGRALAVAVAAQAVGLTLYFVFRATVVSSRDFIKLTMFWVRVSTAAAGISIFFVVLGCLGVETPLARWYPSLGPGAWRLIGTVGHTPNFAYGYFHIGFFLSLGLLLAVKAGERDVGELNISLRNIWIAAAVHSLAVFLTYSRGVIGGILGLVIITQAIRSRLGRSAILYKTALWVVFAGLLAYGTIFYTYTTDALFTASRAEADSLRLDKSALHLRGYSYKNVQHLPDGAGYIRLPGGLTFLPSQHWYLLKACWRFFTENPISGVGPGRFPEELEALRDSGAGDIPGTLPAQKPHSTWTGALAEGGLPGFAGLIILWAFFLAGAVKRKLKNDPLGLAIYAATAGYVIVGLNMDVMNFRWLWLLFALAATRAGLVGQESGPPTLDPT